MSSGRDSAWSITKYIGVVSDMGPQGPNPCKAIVGYGAGRRGDREYGAPCHLRPIGPRSIMDRSVTVADPCQPGTSFCPGGLKQSTLSPRAYCSSCAAVRVCVRKAHVKRARDVDSISCCTAISHMRCTFRVSPGTNPSSVLRERQFRAGLLVTDHRRQYVARLQPL